jgi:branched-chain amino acid transport system substrate-binding protein
MRNLLRLSAVLTAMLIALAACTAESSESAGPSGSQAAESQGAVDAAAICAADEFGCVEIPDGDPIRLASANTFSGGALFLGLDVEYGVEVAINDRAQIKGHDVEVVRQDAGCGDAASGQTAAQAIVADDTIAGVIGTTCSRTAVPAMPVLAEKGLTMISASNTAPSLTDPDQADFGGSFYFRTAYNDLVQGAAVAKYACEELDPTPQTAATIHDGSPYAQQLQQVFQDEFKSQCGGTITSADAIAVGDAAFQGLLTTICANHPDLLFYPVFDPEGGTLTQQTQEVSGCEDTILFGADGIKDAGFITQAGALAAELGMYFSGPDLNFGTAYEEDFLPKYRALSGTADVLAPYAAHGFDAANILMDAITEVSVEDADGTLWIPRDAVRAYVAALTDYPGLTGTLTCNEFGDCGSPYVSVATLQGDPLTYTSVWTTRPE